MKQTIDDVRRVATFRDLWPGLALVVIGVVLFAIENVH